MGSKPREEKNLWHDTKILPSIIEKANPHKKIEIAKLDENGN